MKKYFPILLSKAGELSALSKLPDSVKNEISPIIQVIPGDYTKIKSSFSNWITESNELFLDFSLCKDFKVKETEDLISTLLDMGVKVVPAVQENSDPLYYNLLDNFISDGTIDSICIRFSNDSGGFLKIHEKIDSIITRLNTEQRSVSLLLDFGYITKDNYRMASDIALNKLSSIPNISDFKYAIVASGSFPKDLSDFKNSPDPHFQPRFEWRIWEDIKNEPSLPDTIRFADYGTKHPFYDPSTIAYQGTCSIRYSLEKDFLVYKGQLPRIHKLGNGQYIMFAHKLIKTPHFYGKDFSWGDEQISIYADRPLVGPKVQPGGGQRWVEISQNHHISLMASLL